MSLEGFVVTHEAREALAKKGTTFNFVAGGLRAPWKQRGRRPAKRMSRSRAARA